MLLSCQFPPEAGRITGFTRLSPALRSTQAACRGIGGWDTGPEKPQPDGQKQQDTEEQRGPSVGFPALSVGSSDPSPKSSAFYDPLGRNPVTPATVSVLRQSKDPPNFEVKTQRPHLLMERVSKNLWTYF